MGEELIYFVWGNRYIKELAAGYSVGSREAPEAARMELKDLLDDMDVYASGMEGLL